MKKIIAIILILALIFTFAACGNNTANNGEDNNEPQTQDGGEETQEGEDAQEGGEDAQEGEDESKQTNPISGLTGNTSELSLGSVHSIPVEEGVAKLCDLVEEYSTGTVIIKENTEDTPVSGKKRLQKVIDGELDIAIGLSDDFAPIIKDLHVFDMYYLFESKEEVHNVVLTTEMADALQASFEKYGLKCLSLWGNGFRELTTNKKKVKKPADLKKLKIATSTSEIDEVAWKAMGAKAVTMKVSKRAKAIEKKKIDGQESDLDTIINEEYQNLENYCILTDHTYSPYVVVMNLEKYNSLSEIQRKALMDSVVYARNLELERCDAYNKYAMDLIDKSEMDVIELTEKQKQIFQKKIKAAKIRSKVRKLMDDPEILKYLEGKLEVYRVESTTDETEEVTIDFSD